MGNDRSLTPAQRKALDFARSDGCVFAGYNCRRDGSRFRVSPSTIHALGRLGLLVMSRNLSYGLHGHIPAVSP